MILLGLSACGGDIFSLPVSLPNFAGIGSGTATSADFNRLATVVSALNQATTSGAIELGKPLASTASYNGLVSTSFASGTSVVGKMQLNADFSANTVSGTTSDYLILVASSLGGGTVTPTGTIPITAGTITGNALNATMNGTLTTGLGNYDLTSNLTGSFAKNGSQSVIVGNIGGSVVSPDSTTSGITSGVFAGLAQ